MTGPLLEVSLTAGYGKTTTLQQLSFNLYPGERAGVVGTSGAGKSTLVLALLGMLPWRKGWAKGHVRLLGTDILSCPGSELRRLRGKVVGLVPQNPASSLNPALTLQSHFDESWRAHARRGQAQAKRMHHLLERVDLPRDAAFLKRLPGQISIGQAQRVMIALALLHKPSLLLADEPTSALDVCTQQEIVRLLHDVSRDEATTLLYVSHDLVSVLQLCERMFVISCGALVESIDLAPDPLQAHHPATLKLLQTLPASPAEVRRTYMSSFQHSSATYTGTAETAVLANDAHPFLNNFRRNLLQVEPSI